MTISNPQPEHYKLALLLSHADTEPLNPQLTFHMHVGGKREQFYARRFADYCEDRLRLDMQGAIRYVTRFFYQSFTGSLVFFEEIGQGWGEDHLYCEMLPFRLQCLTGCQTLYYSDLYV